MTKDQFIEFVRKELGIEDTGYAEMATAAVLRTLHDRLTEGEADHIEAHLPKELKPLWSKGLTEKLVSMWRGPEKMDKSVFLNRVQERSCVQDKQTSQQLTKGVFKALKKQLPDKAVKDVKDQLPRDLKGLWNAS